VKKHLQKWTVFLIIFAMLFGMVSAFANEAEIEEYPCLYEAYEYPAENTEEENKDEEEEEEEKEEDDDDNIDENPIEELLIAISGGPIMVTSRSMDYIASMGMGWNLGNTLDGRGGGSTVSGWETSWGNPVTTQALIQSIANRGFGHTRIPFTIDDRVTDRGAAIPDNELRFVITPEWLARYLEIVQWAYNANLYVIINIHHDSWIWLGREPHNWRGDTNAPQYRRFRDHWTEIAEAFAHFGDRVSFETINEPHFYGNAIEQQAMLDTLNQAAFDIIRATPGNENRIIHIPTVWTGVEANRTGATRDFIATLNDENIVAHVHYYGPWLFGSNLGVTMIDESLDESGVGGQTTRTSAMETFQSLHNHFISEGIGINIGEWGVLAYDSGDDIMQRGEELKYYELIKHLASEIGANLTFWDNGAFIDRRSNDYRWHQPRIGEMLEASMRGERSSYATGLDTLYFQAPVSANVNIPLTLNGNTFVGIQGLTQGTDFTFANDTVTLTQTFVNNRFNAMGNDYGIFATLVMQFNNGADWHQFLVRNSTPEYNSASGTRGGISIPLDLNGNHVRRISASQSGTRVGGSQLWWPFLHNGEAFRVNYATEHLVLLSNFFSGTSIQQGEVILRVEMFDGQILEIALDVHGTGSTALVEVGDPNAPVNTPVTIASIAYYFTVAGVDGEAGPLQFNITADGWQDFHPQIPAINGEHTATANWSPRAGIINLGFFTVIPNTDITVTVDKIVINGDIELTFETPQVLILADGGNNGLPHRWLGLANDTVIASSDDGIHVMLFRHFGDPSNDGLLMLYELAPAGPPAPVITPIRILTYHLTVAGATGSSPYQINYTTAPWVGRSFIIPAENGLQSVTADFGINGVAGLYNMGYVPTGDPLPAGVTIVWDRITVNEFDMNVVNPITLGGGVRDLPNRWDGTPGDTIIAITANGQAWLAFDPVTELFMLYVLENPPNNDCDGDCGCDDNDCTYDNCNCPVITLLDNANLAILRAGNTNVLSAASTNAGANVNVSNATTSVTITAIPACDEASVEITVSGSATIAGNVVSGLPVGRITITVTVTAEDSTTKTYTIIVNRASASVSTDPTQPSPPQPPLPPPPAQTITVETAGIITQVGVDVENGAATLHMPSGIVSSIINNTDGHVTFNLTDLDDATTVVIPGLAWNSFATANRDIHLEFHFADGIVIFDSAAVYYINNVVSSNRAITVTLEVDGETYRLSIYAGSVAVIDPEGEITVVIDTTDEDPIPPIPPPVIRFTVGVMAGDAAPFIDPAYDRLMLPLRAVMELLGAEVEWVEATQTVIITKGDTVILLQVGEPLPNGMGNPYHDTQSDRVFVPARYVAETLGADVEWDEATQTAYIFK